jgi:hypothetical protein
MCRTGLHIYLVALIKRFACEVTDTQYRILHLPPLRITGAEAHGGATYCGTASLTLLGAVEELGEKRAGDIKQWCMSR